MTLTVHASQDNNEIQIRIDGRFDFSVHREFRDAYKGDGRSYQRYVVDLSQTEYMDSSALGMLLLLREHAGGDSARVIIRNPTDGIRKILGIANFDKLFELA